MKNAKYEHVQVMVIYIYILVCARHYTVTEFCSTCRMLVGLEGSQKVDLDVKVGLKR